MKKPQNTGRPKNTDPEAIVKALQEKYPNGSPFKSADDLFEANPEYLPKWVCQVKLTHFILHSRYYLIISDFFEVSVYSRL